mmetsp:Transcript_8059/g.9257  ORF Transcript_8059/g.9257 Transcript_8059/m.9257 type:complete len:308 (-) Transcript_8059:264-1187(-)
MMFRSKLIIFVVSMLMANEEVFSENIVALRSDATTTGIRGAATLHSRDDEHDSVTTTTTDNLLGINSGDCDNDLTFLWQEEEGKNCTWAVQEKNCHDPVPNTWSVVKLGGNKQVQFFCPRYCDEKCLIQDHLTWEATAAARQQRGDCENQEGFLFKGLEGKDCASWASQGKNCRKRVPKTGKSVTFFCPQECKAKCSVTTETVVPIIEAPIGLAGDQELQSVPVTVRGECDDDPTFLWNDEEGKDCAWASKEQNCDEQVPTTWTPVGVTGGNNKQVQFFCPQNCVEKCIHSRERGRHDKGRSTSSFM